MAATGTNTACRISSWAYILWGAFFLYSSALYLSYILTINNANNAVGRTLVSPICR